MATVNFLYRSTKEVAPLTVRLLYRDNDVSETKDFVFGAQTKYRIEKTLWDKINSNSREPETKNKRLEVYGDLQKIENHILTNFDNTPINRISKDWLTHQIEIFYNPINESYKSDLIIDAIQELIDNAQIRKNGTGGIGLSKSRINSYKSLKKMITEYQGFKRYKVKEVNVKFANDFLKHLLNTKKYQKSYALKKIADLKTVCYDAETHGIEVNPQLKKVESAKTKNENIIYLSTQELDQIEEAHIVSDALQNARKWLLLGCHLGQRGSDLLNLNEKNFVNRNGLNVIELKQQKTGKNVTIPVLEKTQEILKTGLPYKISIQKFNEHIKDVCELAKINHLIKGSKIVVTEKGKGNIHKRKIEGIYPKYDLIGSHVCRRTFSTNLYGILPTPLIMQITAHSSEKMFLNYIGKDSLDYAQQIADFYTLQAQKEKKQSNLKIVKKASN